MMLKMKIKEINIYVGKEAPGSDKRSTLLKLSTISDWPAGLKLRIRARQPWL